MKTTNKYIKALNLMDEYASETVRDNDNGEAQKLEKAYNLLFDYILHDTEKEILKAQLDELTRKYDKRYKR